MHSVKWIRPQDELPRRYERVLLYIKEYGIVTGCYNGNGVWTPDNLGIVDETVSYWAPLPPLPKEDD